MAAATPRIRRLQRIDRAAVTIISLGGIAVVVSVIGILLFIAAEAIPLFRSAKAQYAATIRAGQSPTPAVAVLGTDESGQYMYDVAANGALSFFDQQGKPLFERPTPITPGASVTSGSRSLSGDAIALATSDGRAHLLAVRFSPVYDDKGKVSDVKIDVAEKGVVALEGPSAAAAASPAASKAVAAPAGRAIQRVAYVDDGDRKVVAGQVADRQIAIWWSEAEQEHRALVSAPDGQTFTTVAVGRTGTVVAGTSAGTVHHWELVDGATLTDISRVSSSPITALNYLIGNHTFIAGTADGHVSAWFRAPVGADESMGMVRSLEFEPQGGAITTIAASTRDRTFATGSSNGTIFLRHQTSGRTLLTLDGKAAVSHVVMTPRSNGMLARRGDAGVDLYSLTNPHPEISFHTLFGKVWYEGYPKPEYVWQSTGANDDFEPKLSLVPLIFGTIKGTIYALVFAIPIAVLAALYTSQFVHTSMKAKIKPTIEIMAALPSVVIGFIAGLYLAPVVERNIVGVGLMLIALPLFGTSGLAVWNLLPEGLRRKLTSGAELFVILPMLLIGGWLALAIAPGVEAALFNGDARQWLSTALGITYDQRNSLVVGLAMGFAVIPIIFTISEDAFSSVPSNLTAASLALGASRWQTAVRVVIPTASPGVFSAIMIGFGRAVGETMIVLMATGNTPVIDWSIFNGFRTLSANIAVEIGEAPQGGTLYRTLFLSAALLFMMTFTLNTVAELIRQRLRERYKTV